MNKLRLTTILLLLSVSTVMAQKHSGVISKGVSASAAHMASMVDSLDVKSEVLSPRTFEKEKIVYHTLDSWTSGFFPGSLWYLYEMTGDDQWRERAVKYTEAMEHIKYYKGNHDIGFMINCSFGNGLRLTDKKSYEDVLVTAANTLLLRYIPGAGVIQSWNSSKKWGCPVIIDNMMNLELLFEATKLSGDKKYWDVAVSHADKTMTNHYRADNSCYHVIDYDKQTGEVLNRNTHQGYADESSWSRGQAWGLYGYIICYRYTKDAKYLRQAEKIVDFIFNNPNLPKDLIPYWDYDVPQAEKNNEPRDASAAAITASALYEMSQYVKDGKKCKILADRIVKDLTSSSYTAAPGENGHFVLMHSTGSKPHKVELDVPLVYADYYYLEALKRKIDLEK